MRHYVVKDLLLGWLIVTNTHPDDRLLETVAKCEDQAAAIRVAEALDQHTTVESIGHP